MHLYKSAEVDLTSIFWGSSPLDDTEGDGQYDTTIAMIHEL